MATIFIGFICALIASFAIMMLLGVVDIVKGTVTGKPSNLAEDWGTLMEAILGFACAAIAAVAVPLFALAVLFILFMALFG